MKACFLDLECNDLQPDFGVILSAAIKPVGGRVKSFVKTAFGSNDGELIRGLLKELENYDIIIGYNVWGFDLRFLAARMAFWKLKPTRRWAVVDAYRLAKGMMRLHSSRLEHVAEHLGIKGKTRVEPRVWMRAALDGDKEALAKIVRHNRFDVIVLERVWNEIKNHFKGFTGWWP